MPMLAVTTRSLAPRMRPLTCGDAWTTGLKSSPPTAMPAAAAPTREANSRRVMPFCSSLLAMMTPRVQTPASGTSNAGLRYRRAQVHRSTERPKNGGRSDDTRTAALEDVWGRILHQGDRDDDQPLSPLLLRH